jgi:hypothetical protein
MSVRCCAHRPSARSHSNAQSTEEDQSKGGALEWLTSALKKPFASAAEAPRGELSADVTPPRPRANAGRHASPCLTCNPFRSAADKARKGSKSDHFWKRSPTKPPGSVKQARAPPAAHARALDR